MDKLLSPQQAADQLGTSLRFVRRLIFERRIAYTKLGRHVRIVASDLDAFITAGRVDAATWAELLGTITYEVLCGIGPRVPRIYLGEAD